MDLTAAIQSVFKELGDGREYPETLHEDECCPAAVGRCLSTQ